MRNRGGSARASVAVLRRCIGCSRTRPRGRLSKSPARRSRAPHLKRATTGEVPWRIVRAPARRSPPRHAPRSPGELTVERLAVPRPPRKRRPARRPLAPRAPRRRRDGPVRRRAPRTTSSARSSLDGIEAGAVLVVLASGLATSAPRARSPPPLSGSEAPYGLGPAAIVRAASRAPVASECLHRASNDEAPAVRPATARLSTGRAARGRARPGAPSRRAVFVSLLVTVASKSGAEPPRGDRVEPTGDSRANARPNEFPHEELPRVSRRARRGPCSASPPSRRASGAVARRRRPRRRSSRPCPRVLQLLAPC